MDNNEKTWTLMKMHQAHTHQSVWFYMEWIVCKYNRRNWLLFVSLLYCINIYFMHLRRTCTCFCGFLNHAYSFEKHIPVNWPTFVLYQLIISVYFLCYLNGKLVWIELFEWETHCWEFLCKKIKISRGQRNYDTWSHSLAQSKHLKLKKNV